ncbi:MAG: hypothetical protein EPN23_05855 [Verrucomicrobia bacterium]|nr:MAG: hypothetical protein EPN23_05855 [Verrucomicrobiota bacterium]
MKIRVTGIQWSVLGLIALVAALGSISLSSPPVLDDVNEWNYLASWKESGRNSALDCFGYFRPIKNIFFTLCAPSPGGTIIVAHVVTLICYALLTLLCWLAARRLLNHERWALAATALFVLAPTQLSAVAWFSCTTNVVMNIMMILATLLVTEKITQHAQNRATWAACGYGLLASFCAALALLSYEEAVALPLLFLLWQYARQRSLIARPTLIMTSVLGLIVATYLLVRLQFQGITSSANSGFFPPLKNIEVSLASAYFTLHHLGLWLWPWNRLTLFAGYPPTATLAPFLFPASWLLLFAISWLAFRVRHAMRFLWIGWLWFLFAFFPLSNLLPFRNGPFADYYLLLPSFGLALAVADILRFCWQHRRTATGAQRQLAALVGLVLALSRIGAFAELPRGLWAWRETNSLNRYLLHADPVNYVILANWGHFFIQAKQLDTAEQLLASAQQLAPWFDYAIQLRGEIALARTNYPAALQFFAEAHRLNPADAFPLKAQGYIRECQGQHQASLVLYKQALARRWDGDSVRLAVAVANQLVTLGRTNEACALFQRAQQFAPRHPALTYWTLGNRREK